MRPCPIGSRFALAAGLAFGLLSTGCDSPAITALGDAESTPPDVAGAVVSTPLPFRASAYTGLQGLAPDPACGAPPWLLNTQAGEGEATHLGRFQVTFTFCIDATDLLDDGMLTEGESVPYTDGVGTITAANGDILYLAISGVIHPSADPDYDFEFEDAFTVEGGTGRFDGAAGGGTALGKVVQATNITDHSWSGTLVLERGRD